MAMDKNRNDQQTSSSNQEERDRHNPFKEKEINEEELPEEDAEAEQQRKEALTERD